MNDRKYYELSENARLHAQKFNWKHTASRIGEIYENALQ